MHDDPLKSRWRELRPELRRHFERLEEADLAMIDGDRDYLVQALGTRYAWPPERAEREVARVLRRLGCGRHAQAPWSAEARAALAPGAAKLREGLHDLTRSLQELRGGAVEAAKEALRSGIDGLGNATGTAAHGGAEQVRRAAGRIEAFVRERPLLAIGLAAAAGWLLLGRRRR